MSRLESVRCGVFSGAAAAALAWLGPPGSDLAAHEYQRWLFLHHGFALWDNYWYSGRYVFVTYSWLTYPLAALVGVKLLFVSAVAVAAAAFARVVRYGPAAWAFAIVWGCFVLSGALPFALGVAFALLALAFPRLFVPLAVLTWASSPLALLLLAVVVVGLRRWRGLGILLPLLVLQTALAHLYPNAGHFPFSWQEAGAAALFCVGGLLVARDRDLRGVLAAWLVLVAFSFLFPSTLGENAARLRFMALPIALLALRGRPVQLAVPLLAVAAAYNVSPLAWSFDKGLDERAEHASYWAPAIAWLQAHAAPNFRVDALDTVGHWEAAYLPKAGIPITRGWFRQDDFPQNRVLYHPLTPVTYARWLRAQGVRYVLAPNDRLDYSERYESRQLARTLQRVGTFGDVEIFELPRPTPIVPGARVLRLTHDSITVRVPRRGRYHLAVRDDSGGWRGLDASRAGATTLRFP